MPIGFFAALLGAALLRERMRRRSTGGIWWSSVMIASKALNAKPLGFEAASAGRNSIEVFP